MLLMRLYDVLRGEFGHRDWWPGDGPFEVMVGAVLTQRTAWRNVERALQALKDADVLSAQALACIDSRELQSLIKSAGYYRQKAVRLQRLAAWVAEAGLDDPRQAELVPTGELRENLLALRGIGPETADSILLYALGRLAFVVDAYTKRAMVRHRLVDPDCGYYELKSLFESNLPDDVELFRDYHAQLVELGKRYCRPSPRCEGCPARRVLGNPCLEEP